MLEAHKARLDNYGEQLRPVRLSIRGTMLANGVAAIERFLGKSGLPIRHVVFALCQPSMRYQWGTTTAYKKSPMHMRCSKEGQKKTVLGSKNAA